MEPKPRHVVAAFRVICYLLPTATSAGTGVLLEASAIAAALRVPATAGFRLSVSRFGWFSRTRGLPGGVIVLLPWMCCASLLIVPGGEIAAEMERGAWPASRRAPVAPLRPRR